MLGVKLTLDFSRQALLNDAMDRKIKTLNIGEIKIYQLAKRKINEGAVLDGMFMRCFENSLIFASNQTINENKKFACRQLAKDIEKKRLEFQYTSMEHLKLG